MLPRPIVGQRIDQGDVGGQEGREMKGLREGRGSENGESICFIGFDGRE